MENSKTVIVKIRMDSIWVTAYNNGEYAESSITILKII